MNLSRRLLAVAFTLVALLAGSVAVAPAASPSILLVANSAIRSGGNRAGLWGNDTIDQKLHDIAGLGLVVLASDFSMLKIVGLTQRSSLVQRPPSEVPTYAN